MDQRSTFARPLAGIATLLAGFAGAAESPPSQAFNMRMMAHKGYFNERCMELSPATLRFELDSPYPVEINLHHHTDTATEYPVAARIEQKYAATVKLVSAGEYCFMLRNVERRSEAFTLRLSYETGAP
jgi:hypothetical protein